MKKIEIIEDAGHNKNQDAIRSFEELLTLLNTAIDKEDLEAVNYYLDVIELHNIIASAQYVQNAMTSMTGLDKVDYFAAPLTDEEILLIKESTKNAELFDDDEIDNGDDDWYV